MYITKQQQQQIFDLAVAGMRSQNWQPSVRYSELGTPTCLYRDAEHNRKCAVGHLIADEHYNHFMEGFPASEDSVEDAVCESLSLVEDIRTVHRMSLSTFLSELQLAHDGEVGRDSTNIPELIEQKFREFAAEYQVSWPEA